MRFTYFARYYWFVSREAFAEGWRDGLRVAYRGARWPWRALQVVAAKGYGFAERMHELEQATCKHPQLRMLDARTADGQYGVCQYLRVWLECIDCGEWWFVQGRSPGPLAHNVRDAKLRGPSSDAVKLLSQNAAWLRQGGQSRDWR